jgi:serine/threonine protein kinase
VACTAYNFFPLHALKGLPLRATDTAESCALKVADFGNAFVAEDDIIALYGDDFEVQPLQYRAPEVLAGLEISQAIDLWSLGCLLAEVRPGGAFRSLSNVEPAMATNTLPSLSPLTALSGPPARSRQYPGRGRLQYCQHAWATALNLQRRQIRRRGATAGR